MAEMVEVPWVDGTTRLVEENTMLLLTDADDNYRWTAVARKTGFSRWDGPGSITFWGALRAKAILTESETIPSKKVTLPTGIGAIIDCFLDTYIHKHTGWISSFSGYAVDTSVVEDVLSYDETKVLSEGVPLEEIM